MDRNKTKKKLFFYYFFLWVLLVIALYLSYGVYFIDTTSTKSKWVGLFAGSIALLLATYKILEISYASTKNAAIEKVSKYFQNGTLIFLNKLFKVCAFLFGILIIPYLFMNISSIDWMPFKINFSNNMGLGIPFFVCLITGGLFTFFAIIVSAIVTSKTITRSSQFYVESDFIALKQLFNCGIGVSFFNIAFAIIPLVILFHIFKDYQALNGFVFGSAIVAIINNVSSVIARQASQNASDVVCGFVAEIDEKDKRNPLLLLRGVSNSVLGVNVLASDLFVSFCAILVSAMTIGGEFMQLMGMFLPVVIAGSAIFVNVLVALFTRVDKTNNLVKTLFGSMFVSNILLILVCAFLIHKWLPDFMGLVLSVAVGAIGGYLICFSHSNFIFSKYKPILNVSNSTISGSSFTIKQTIKEGFSGVVAPAVIFSISIILAFVLPGGVSEPSLGLFGIVLAFLASISSLGVILGANIFGLAACNTDNVLETYEEDICQNNFSKSSFLNSSVSYIISLGKNYINALSIFAALVMIISYTLLIGLEQVDIINPYVIASIILGAAVPYLYFTSVMGIVSKTARRLVLDVKKQIKSFPQILRYEMRPDFEECVKLSAINSSIQVVINTLLIVIIGIIIALKLKEEALCGYVFGALISSFGLIFLMSGTSLVAKGAKKYFISQFGLMKNTQEYSAINLNEAVFSSLKDLMIPSLNALIKFMAIAIMALVPIIM